MEITNVYVTRKKREASMDQAVAQQNLEAVMTNLLPLVSFVNGKSCVEATIVLANLLEEALDAQEASSKRAVDLKTMKAKDLLSFLSPVRMGAKVATASETTPTNKKTTDELRQEGTAKETKRQRKPAEKVIKQAEEEEEDDEQGEDQWNQGEEKKLKKKVAKVSLKVAGGAWRGEEFPRITKVIKCQGDGLDFRMEVYAKKSGRGHWVETLYTLDSMDLSKIDRFSQISKDIVADSCQKALNHQYGLHWPSQVRSALGATTWGKAIIPVQEAAEFLPEADGEGMNLPGEADGTH